MADTRLANLSLAGAVLLGATGLLVLGGCGARVRGLLPRLPEEATGLLVLGGCGAGRTAAQPEAGRRTRVIAFVGAASVPPSREAKAAFEAANPDIVIDMTFGGSGTLLNQMELERIGDLYMPGSDDFMDKAEARGVVRPETRRDVVFLIPVICVRSGNPKNIQSLADLARPGITVGLAQAGAVCLGDWSERVLKAAGLEEAVKRNVITYAASCEHTQQLIEMGEVDAVIGWDAFEHWAPGKVDIVPIPVEYWQRPPSIPVAISTFAQHPEAAQRYIDFLLSEEGKAIFAKHGYSVTKPEV